MSLTRNVLVLLLHVVIFRFFEELTTKNPVLILKCNTFSKRILNLIDVLRVPFFLFRCGFPNKWEKLRKKQKIYFKNNFTNFKF